MAGAGKRKRSTQAQAKNRQRACWHATYSKPQRELRAVGDVNAASAHSAKMVAKAIIEQFGYPENEMERERWVSEKGPFF